MANKKTRARAATRRDRSGTDEPRAAISDMYARWTLDCVIEASSAVAADFVRRPRQYASVEDGDTLKHLEDLWYRSGNDPSFPDSNQRLMIFTPLLGPSDGKAGEHASQFHDDSRALRERARAFSERQVQTGEDNLRQAFRDEVDTFGSYLIALVSNSVVENGDRQTLNVFSISASILRDEKIAGVFGRPKVNSRRWPLDDNFEEQGARLIEEISKTLEISQRTIVQSQFIVMQRIALYGALTINGVVTAKSGGNQGNIDGLIQLAYSWKTALDALVSGPPV